MTGYGVPEIFESEASGVIYPIYRDIQYVLKVPIVNFMFRSLAFYEKFLSQAWREVRPNMLTIEGEKAAESLRYPDITAEIPRIQWSKVYSQQTLEKLEKTIQVFNTVNPKLLLIVSAWAESLGNRPNLGIKKSLGFIPPGIPQGLPKINLIEIPSAPYTIESLLLDIAEKHHAIDVASDYRALAYYPHFLETSWHFLRSFIGTQEYTVTKQRLLAAAIQRTKELPFPITINRQTLEHVYSPRDIAGIMGFVVMFQNLIPELIIDGEFFRRILDA